jgi:HopA1 effector protein family
MSVTVRVGVPAEVQEALGRLVALVGRDRHGSVTVGGVAIEPDDGSSRVADIIYGAWYTLDPSADTPGVHPRHWRVDLVPVLRAAHAHARRFEDGWVVTASSPDGRCWLAKHGASRLAQPGDYANLTRPGVPPAPGEMVAVVARVDWVDEPSGFWFTADPPRGPAPPLSRAYVNVRSDTVAPVLHLLTEALSQAGLAYTLKCPRGFDGYARTDAVVVYHERARAHQAQALLGSIAHELGALLQPGTPPLTRQLAPGLAFADDPGGGKSFGEHICAALAPGLWAVAQAGAIGEGAVATLLTALETAGINPAKPWLDRSSATAGDT